MNADRSRRRSAAGEAALSPDAGSESDLSEILLSVAEDKPEFMDRRYRFWNFYSYVVCYVWETKPVQIVAIVHGARDLGAFFTTRAH